VEDFRIDHGGSLSSYNPQYIGMGQFIGYNIILHEEDLEKVVFQI